MVSAIDTVRQAELLRLSKTLPPDIELYDFGSGELGVQDERYGDIAGFVRPEKLSDGKIAFHVFELPDNASDIESVFNSSLEKFKHDLLGLTKESQ